MITPCIFADEVSKDFEEAVRLCVEAGAQGIELRGGIWGKNVTTADNEDVKRMQDALARHGARIAVVASPFGKCRHDRPEEVAQHYRYFDRMIELAKAFGTDIIRGFAFWVPGYRDHRAHPPLEQSLETILPLLQPVVDLAAREGVVLAIEPEADCMVGTAREARVLIDALGGKGVAFCWDVNNAAGLGELPLPDAYQHVRGLVRHVQVKPDKDKTMVTAANTPVSYQQIFRALQADGYNGAASIEHWGSPELTLKGLRELVAALGRL